MKTIWLATIIDWDLAGDDQEAGVYSFRTNFGWESRGEAKAYISDDYLDVHEEINEPGDPKPTLEGLEAAWEDDEDESVCQIPGGHKLVVWKVTLQTKMTDTQRLVHSIQETEREKEIEMKVKIEKYGLIENGPFEGLYLRALLDTMRKSAWDWPTAMDALGIEGTDTMHPEEVDLEVLKKIAPEEDWEGFDLLWDT